MFIVFIKIMTGAEGASNFSTSMCKLSNIITLQVERERFSNMYLHIHLSKHKSQSVEVWMVKPRVLARNLTSKFKRQV